MPSVWETTAIETVLNGNQENLQRTRDSHILPDGRFSRAELSIWCSRYLLVYTDIHHFLQKWQYIQVLFAVYMKGKCQYCEPLQLQALRNEVLPNLCMEGCRSVTGRGVSWSTCRAPKKSLDEWWCSYTGGAKESKRCSFPSPVRGTLVFWCTNNKDLIISFILSWLFSELDEQSHIMHVEGKWPMAPLCVP